MRNNKNILKRVLCSIMVLVLFATAFVGCAKNGDDPAPKEPGQEQPDTNDKDSDSAGESGEPTKFSLAAQRLDAQPPVNEVTLVKEIVDKANVEIDWIDWPASAVSEKKSLAFASGDYPDAIMGAWVVGTSEVVDYASQGILVALDEYINGSVMPNFTKILEKRPHYENELTTPDGNIYALPSLEEGGLRPINDTFVMNTEWLEKVDKPMPETTDDLYEVLKAFKEAGDLNENGENDEIPMTFFYGDHMRGHSSIVGWFGNPQSQTGFTTRDGEMIFNAAQPEYKEAIKYLHKLHSEGLIDPESLTTTSESYDAKIRAKTPFVGAAVNWNKQALNEAIGREVFEHVPPLKSAPDVTPVWQSRVMPLTSNLSFVMTDKAEDREGILKFIDLFYDTETSITNFRGVIGKHIEHVEGNSYRWILKEDGTEPVFEDRYPDVQTNRGIWFILEEDFQWAEPTQADLIDQGAVELYSPFVEKNPDPKGWQTMDETEQITILDPDIREYVNNTTAKWIADGGIDEGWDEYLKQLDNLGLQEYLKYKQAAYDRMNN